MASAVLLHREGLGVSCLLFVDVCCRRSCRCLCGGKDYADRLADLERERSTIELEKEQVTTPFCDQSV